MWGAMGAMQSRQKPYPRDEADDNDNCLERLSYVLGIRHVLFRHVCI